MAGKILVFGSYVVDLMARAPHLPAPGETVLGSFFQMGPGGKGFNQAVAAHLAGGQVTMATKIGDDMFGKHALDYMAKIGMDSGRMIVTDQYASATALILVDENTGENSIVVTPDACGQITAAEVDALGNEISGSDYLLTQLEINIDANERAMYRAKEAGVQVVLNPAPVQSMSEALYGAVDLITPNEAEAQGLTGIAIETEADAARAADFFFERGVKRVIITLGERGAFVADGTDQRIVPGFKVEALDTTGAGDAFNGGLLAALAEGRDIWEATVFAHATAALSVQKLGTSVAMPTRAEIDAFLARETP